MLELFFSVINMSIIASIVIIVVLPVRFLLKRAPKVFSYALWAVVLFRLLFPVSLKSAVSLIPDTTIIQPGANEQSTFSIDTGINAVNTTINYYFKERYYDGISVTDGTMHNPLFILAVIWITGIVALLIYSICSLIRLRRKLVGAVPLRGNIYLADHIESPFVMGLFCPKIYLPSSLAKKEQNYIIQHEQHHIHYGDHVIKILSFAALCIHWFNPLVWLVFVLSGEDMEMSCDEAMMKKMDCDIRADYSASLLSFATGRRIISGIPTAFGEGNMKGRIRNVMNYKKPASWIIVLCLILVAGLSITLILNSNRISNANQLEQAARQSKTIGEDWNVQLAKTDDLAVLLFYSNDMSDHSFSIYRNKNKVFPNYVFIRGGSLSEIERSILTYNYDGSLVLLSMNSDRIAQIICHDGETYEVNPDSPFAIIVPQGGYDILNEAGNRIIRK